MQRRKFLGKTLKSTLVLGAFPSIISCKNRKNESPGAAIGSIAEEVDRIVPGLLDDAGVPALAIAILQDGKRVWSKGFGVASVTSGKPVNADTVFECASVSKTVFSYAVMKLCEEGILNLDRPLIEYGLSPGLDDPRTSAITARHILSHQSGMQNWRTPEEPLKLHFDPGTDFMYSGEGYFYLQSVITHLVGTTNRSACGKFEAGVEVCASDIGEYLEGRVLFPLGMKSSGYLTRPSMAENYAFPHDQQGKMFSKPPQGNVDLARYAAAGSLLTTANDYSTFLSGLLQPAGNDQHRLNADSLEAMFAPQVKLPATQQIDGASAWALGWAVQERSGGNVVLHSGGQPGYRSLAMMSRDRGSGFVMLTNSDNGGAVVYNEALGRILNKLLPEV